MHKRRHAVVFTLLIWTALTAAASYAQVNRITGAGATFPFPLYAKWAQAYSAQTGVRVNYQSIGSGGGIRQVKEGTVDFGAADVPLKPSELTNAGLLQFPTVMGGVVLVVNIPGFKAGDIKLTPEVVAAIFMGEITQWDDPRIAQVNAGHSLPAMPVSVVHRADASGTTWIFTNYLTKVSRAWATQVGNEMAVSWPTGVGGKGNEGVASYVSRIKGAIGYVEYAYALQNHMAFTQLKNHDGLFVAPGIDTFEAAATHANWQSVPSFYMVFTDMPGNNAWPIVGATFILVHASPEKPTTTHAVLKFFDWAYRHGDAMAKKLQYVPLPEKVKELVRRRWKETFKGAGGQAVWP